MDPGAAFARAADAVVDGSAAVLLRGLWPAFTLDAATPPTPASTAACLVGEPGLNESIFREKLFSRTEPLLSADLAPLKVAANPANRWVGWTVTADQYQGVFTTGLHNMAIGRDRPAGQVRRAGRWGTRRSGIKEESRP